MFSLYAIDKSKSSRIAQSDLISCHNRSHFNYQETWIKEFSRLSATGKYRVYLYQDDTLMMFTKSDYVMSDTVACRYAINKKISKGA